MEGTQEAQKPTATEQDLEKAIDICKKYFTKENLGDIQPEAKLALYAIAAEVMPEAVRRPVYAGLAAAYARAADASKEKSPGEAKIYQMIAIQYIQKAGIQMPGTPGVEAGKDILQYMKSIFADKTNNKTYDNRGE